MLRLIRTIGFVLTVGLAIGMVSCTTPTQSATPTATLRPMVFMAGYKPQANLPFVGVYVAKEKGYFLSEGLDVEIQHSTGRGEHLQLLMAGAVQVTTQDAAVLLQRRADPGLPLVSIALIGQRGQQAFAALKSSGMRTPKDWEGKKVGYKGTPPPDLFAIMEAAGVDRSRVELVNVGFDPRVLVQGLVDVYPLFKSNEPYLLRQMGYELVIWEAADYGVPTLGLTYVTSEEQIQRDPDLLVRFLRAAMKGIEDARMDPEEAVDIVLKYAPQADRGHMRFMLETELRDAESEVTRAHGIGWQTREQWEALYEVLRRYNAITRPVEIDRVFTTALLQKARQGTP
ncbi:Formylaminopyrimidine-binding protein [Candidatus Thermoflexus japonica]|uniref:Thiamine pyrimidine synthase n=1 Tax=Candidatus Thermoflexus japonica TaxID=2035417 RepID=A0A2H5Y3W8_9CHLR|nr:Formylaminopyrimidine-binding protein [Candidatus Thermoflexus japonica]